MFSYSSGRMRLCILFGHKATRGFCDLYKIGLISGKGKDFYNPKHIDMFFGWLVTFAFTHKVYLKDSLLKYVGIERDDLRGCFVDSDYNIFQ